MSPNPSIQEIAYLNNATTNVDILRIDEIHAIVSGNKWYKLRFYIEQALIEKANTLASFGGPYSNHLVALAFAAKENNLKCIGYVRSNEGEPITPTLQDAIHYGMELKFLGRTQFQEKKEAIITASKLNSFDTTYYIDEGGYGMIGAKGASTILNESCSLYDYIVCAVGTGTMIAGIVHAAKENQQVIGIPVLKNEGTIVHEIKAIMNNPTKAFTLLHQFHEGGYAKTTPRLIEFMNHLWEHSKIPTDIVYTGKLLFAVYQLVKAQYFATNSKVLVIHSGGLQGNRSLKQGVLHY